MKRVPFALMLAFLANCVDVGMLPEDSTAPDPTGIDDPSAFDDAKADTALHPLERRLRDEDRLTQESISTLAQLMMRLHGGRGVMRHGLHAKAHGCLKGTMTMHASRDARTRHGLFAADASYNVWARISSAQPKTLADASPDARGLALKVTGVPGARLLPDGAATQDFLFFTHPVALAADLRAMPDVLKTVANPAHAAVLLFKFPQVVANTAAAFASSALITNPLEARYWSAAPYKLGNTAAKYFVKPCDWSVDGPRWPLDVDVPNFLSADYLRDALRTQISTKGACFDFMVQFYANQNLTPIENHLKVWTTSVAPFHKVATIQFAAQDFETPARQEFCENVSFNPWRGITDHRPLGNLNRARLKVYKAASELRRTTNRVPHSEPTGTEPF